MPERPYVGSISLQCLAVPELDLSVILFGLDLMCLPLVAPIVRRILADSLSASIVSPQHLTLVTIGTNKFEVTVFFTIFVVFSRQIDVDFLFILATTSQNLSLVQMFKVVLTVVGADNLIASDSGSTKLFLNSRDPHPATCRQHLRPVLQNYLGRRIVQNSGMAPCLDRRTLATALAHLSLLSEKNENAQPSMGVRIILAKSIPNPLCRTDNVFSFVAMGDTDSHIEIGANAFRHARV